MPCICCQYKLYHRQICSDESSMFIYRLLFKKGYQLLDLTIKKVFTSKDVIFHEDVYPYHPDSITKYMTPLPVSTTTIQPKPSWDDIDTTNILTPADSSTTTSSNPSTTFDNSIIPTSPSPPHIRHSSRAHKPLAYLQQYQTYQASSSPVPLITNLAQTAVQPEFNCFMSTLTIHNDPLYYKDVVKDSGRVQAMNTKLHALENNNTGTLTTLPTNKKAIGCKWLFKTNYNLDGSVDRKKERLVVFGCN